MFSNETKFEKKFVFDNVMSKFIFDDVENNVIEIIES